MRRYRITLVGGPSCGSGELTDVESWPPPRYLSIEGYDDGVYRRVRVSDPILADLDFSTARYEWQQT